MVFYLGKLCKNVRCEILNSHSTVVVVVVTASRMLFILSCSVSWLDQLE